MHRCNPAKKCVSPISLGLRLHAFLQHAGVPPRCRLVWVVWRLPLDLDDYAWFVMECRSEVRLPAGNGTVFGLESLRMADADVLPYDYPAYAREITSYLDAAKRKASDAGLSSMDFSPALAAAARFTARPAKCAPPRLVHQRPVNLNQALRAAETALLSPNGLPNRPWYKHTIYAPGEFTAMPPSSSWGERGHRCQRRRKGQPTVDSTHTGTRPCRATLDSAHRHARRTLGWANRLGAGV